MKSFHFILALFASTGAARAACPRGDYVCEDKLSGWNQCLQTSKNPVTCGAEPTTTPPQGFHVYDTKANICEADDGQKFPCGQPTPLHDDRTQGPGRNVAENWNAHKYNTGMFDEQANRDSQKGGYRVEFDGTGQMKTIETSNGSFQTQADAFNAANNVLVGCIGVNIQGRTDNLCTTTPNHPECTGLTLSLQNGVFCAEPPPAGSPPGTPCKSYGAYNYNIEEWLTFSQQYYDGMGSCITTRDSANGTTTRRDNMTALTDMASFPPNVGTGDLKDGSSASSITGKAKVTQAETRAKEMADRFDDGATYLGYERGELIKRAYKGQSFLSAFTDSPFAEKLTKAVKETVDYALGNPGDVVSRAKEKRLAELEKKRQEAENKGESVATSEISGENSPSVGIAGRVLASTENTLPSMLRVELHDGQKTILVGKDSGPLAAGLRAPASSGRANGYRRTALSTTSLTQSPELAPEEPLRADTSEGPAVAATPGPDEASLFQRVNQSYRRYAPKMSVYTESKAARDIRNTETPAFFKDL